MLQESAVSVVLRERARAVNSDEWPSDVLARVNALLTEVQVVADAAWKDYVRTGDNHAYATCSRKLAYSLERTAVAATHVVMSTRRL